MESNTPTENLRIEQFWDGYFETIRLFRVPENAHSWYQKHVETFIQYLPDIRLINREPAHIEQWLNQVGRNVDLPDWQFRQRVDALGLLYCHRLKAPWAADLEK